MGAGAREHALAWKCMQSPLTERVFCAPGNGGTVAAENAERGAVFTVRLPKGR